MAERTPGLRPPPRPNSRGVVRGAVIGLVTNNQDPDNFGRIKVRYPWLGDEIESHWARVVCMYAGPDRGGYILPEVGDEVLVMFERGDPSAPYVVGSLWNGVDTVPGPGNPDGENNTKWWQSRSGHQYIFSDKPGAESITLIDKSQKLKLVIDVPADLITLEATTGDLYFKAPEGPINMVSKTMEILASKSTKVTVGNALTEVSKTRSETVGGTCGATADDLWQMGTKTMTVKFGGVEIDAETATMVVEGSCNQTMGNTQFKADTVHRNSGPETVTAGSIEVHAKRLDVIANSQSIVAGSVSMSSKGDAKITSTACLTVMGGLTSFNAGSAMTTQAGTVTLS